MMSGVVELEIAIEKLSQSKSPGTKTELKEQLQQYRVETT